MAAVEAARNGGGVTLAAPTARCHTPGRSSIRGDQMRLDLLA